MSDTAHDQAAAQVASIVEMVAATRVDYDRLEELQEALNAASDSDEPMDPSEAEELAELEAQAGDCASEGEAWQRIDEDPLSVEFRSGWSDSREALQPEEFRIVLYTNGPHVELRGELDGGSVKRVRVLFKGWGESGELFCMDDAERDLETYCAHFVAC